jgi:HlyD family secretion protein
MMLPLGSPDRAGSGRVLLVLFPVLVLGPACQAAASGNDERWIKLGRGDLALEVDVVGTLIATRSAPVGPPSGLEQNDFKIAQMAPEGSHVKQGTRVLFFDAGEWESELLARTAERDSAAREIERKLHELELSRREGELRVTEAEALTRKAALKADLPAKYTAAVEVKLAEIDLAAAKSELRMARQRLEHSLRLGRAELAYLRDRHTRFAGRAARLQELVQRLSVPAPIDGVVIYRTSWRGEKKKVGDDCEVGEPCVEITDTSEMRAQGEVDELESARVAVGQTLRLRLEALPELEWVGKVESLRPNVYRQSPRNPLKVVGLSVRLEKTDSSRMRPGMQFRGRLETERLRDVLLAPVDAVFGRPDGPVVFRRTPAGWEKVRISVGRRSRTQVEVKSGLDPGDRVARRDLEERPS